MSDNPAFISHAESAHRSAHLAAALARSGIEPSDEDIVHLRFVREYADAILSGNAQRLDPAVIYERAA